MVKPLPAPVRPLPSADHRWTWTPTDPTNTTPWYRIYHRDRFTPNGTTFRRFGPLARFDHHTPTPPAMDPHGRAVLYLAVDLATSACEAFGEAGVAALCPHWRITQVRPVRDIVTYDLTTPGAALAIGALPALAAGNEHRGLTQQWARARQRKSTASATAPPTTTTTPSPSGTATTPSPSPTTAPGNRWTSP